MDSKINYADIIGIKVYLEKKSRKREFVGRLERTNNNYQFFYEESYLNCSKSIPLGPELPLTKREFTSSILFPSLADRIPSKENAAYREYCDQFGINPEEKDPCILLATIGRRGPSSFVFEPIWKETFTAASLKKFRKELGLSTRDFAECFGLTQATVVRIENAQTSGKETLKFIEVLYKIPEAATYFISRHASRMSSETKERVLRKIYTREGSPT
jgi:HipA-like protein